MEVVVGHRGAAGDQAGVGRGVVGHPDAGQCSIPIRVEPLHQAPNQTVVLWANRHRQDGLHATGLVRSGQGQLHADHHGILCTDEVRANARPRRCEAGSPEEGHLWPPNREDVPLDGGRFEHAEQGNLRRAASDRDPQADDRCECVSSLWRLVRQEGLHSPIPRHRRRSSLRRYGAAGRRAHLHHSSDVGSFVLGRLPAP
mmetsp:Transcript_24989/g.71817  ORF Transcript_24989/g.71817 Transcript_24989/m.71817 type:complete len:200 (+) Transcript_24989:1286-1885(+)